MSCMNQLSVWIYEDFEEVGVQWQNSFIKDVSKKKVNTRSIQTMEFYVSPILRINVACVNLDDIPNFIKRLKFLSKFVFDEKEFSSIDFRCC